MFRLLRVKEYVKNVFVFIPVFFGGKLFEVPALEGAFIMFAAFCLAASSIYIFNDVHDVEEDRKHPTKCLRPVACGEISASKALVVAAFLALGALGASFFIGKTPFMVIGLYLTLNVFYSLWAKHQAILDVTCIALGFVLRVVGGTVASGLGISQWLMLMVFLLTMFLGLAKRWDDLVLTESGRTNGQIRKSLDRYSSRFISSCMTFFATINTVCYISYTLSPQVQEYYGSENVFWTTFWVILGNMRYLQIAFVEQNSGSPTRVMIGDRFIRVVVGCWVAHLFILLYLR